MKKELDWKRASLKKETNSNNRTVDLGASDWVNVLFFILIIIRYKCPSIISLYPSLFLPYIGNNPIKSNELHESSQAIEKRRFLLFEKLFSIDFCLRNITVFVLLDSIKKKSMLKPSDLLASPHRGKTAFYF